MNDAQRQRTPGTEGALQDAEAPASSDGQKPGEQSLGLEDVKFEEHEELRDVVTTDSPPGSPASPPGPPGSASGAPGSASLRPAGAITVHVVGRTDVGLVREHNEDNFLLADLGTGSRDPSTFHEVPPAGLLLAVCDGMGGAAAGEVASQMAVDTVFEMMRRSVPAQDRDALARALVRAIEEAGGRIFEGARADRSRRGMGTTSTVATLMDRTLFVGQVGDSRAYILRNGELKQVTKDQSLVNQLIEAGQHTEDEAEAFEHSNIILQALGTTEQVSVDLTFLELRRGDRLLMCSDGLSGLVHGDVIKEVMVEYQDLNACCERLIELAKAGGGHDNVTVILCDFTGEGLSPPQPSDLAGYQQYPLPLEEGRSGHGPNSDVPTLAPPSHRPESMHPRGGYDDGFGGAFAPRSADRPEGSSLRYIVVAVVLLAIAGAIYYWNDRNRQALEQPVQPDVPVVTPVAPEPPARVEVVVRTDVEGGELVVDGESYGTATSDRWVLDLTPGPHKLEARSGGNVVTSSLVSVREGVPATVLLSMPEGAGGTAHADGGAAGHDASASNDKHRKKPAAAAAEGTTEESSAAEEARKKRRAARREAAAKAAEGAASPTPTPAPTPSVPP
jgi:serine/threonine protein phosphatase PrpC